MGAEPFPTQAAFDAAARAFVGKYAGATRGGVGPQRTNAGWEWRVRSDRFRGEAGYMVRRAVFVTEGAEGGSEDGEGEMEEEDEDAVRVPRRARTLEAEFSVVWSATYRVPMLCFSVWDETGAPVPLKDVASHILRSNLPTDTDANTRADALLLPGQPFPLLQMQEHPITGANVWAVHPCEVRSAVNEIIAADDDNDNADMGVRWLEAWTMLTDSVVVSPPD